MAQRKYYRKIYKPNKKKRNFLFFLKLVLLGIAIFVVAVASVFIYYAKDLPRPEKFAEHSFVQSTKIYDRSGQVLLYDIYGEEKRTLVPLSSIPERLQQAVIATEDSNFYNHFGVDIGGIMRSLWINVRSGTLYGGSTISQQLIRSSFLTLNKTVERKFRELILALELERRYSKEQILEWYLNQIPFGSNAYGVESASQTFFNKPVSEISLSESAVLAALIQGPSYLSPYGSNKDKLLERKNYVLERMAIMKYISQEEKEAAQQETIEFSKVLAPIKAPHFVLYVKQQLESVYGEDFLKEKGLKVYTSLDWTLQQLAEEMVEKGTETNEKYYNAHNASLVAINPKTGEILAMVGSKDWFADPYPEGCVSGKNCLFDPKVNISTSLQGRQPGSAFKPFVYITAFGKGYDDTTTVIDEETNFGRWGGQEYIPQNYDGLFRGEVTLRRALAQSLNIPAVKVLVDLAGIKDSIETAQKMGITTLNRPISFYGPALVLGGGEVKLLDMVSAYGVFATEGLRIPPVSILKIEDFQGNIIEKNEKAQKRVLEADTTKIINSILSDNEARAPMFGLKSNLYFENYVVSVKTGTTSDFRDAWTVGYTPNICTGIWVGNNDNSAMTQKPGVTLAGGIWHNFMEKALNYLSQ